MGTLPAKRDQLSDQPSGVTSAVQTLCEIVAPGDSGVVIGNAASAENKALVIQGSFKDETSAGRHGPRDIDETSTQATNVSTAPFTYHGYWGGYTNERIMESP